jgi:hypothetical protein
MLSFPFTYIPSLPPYKTHPCLFSTLPSNPHLRIIVPLVLRTPQRCMVDMMADCEQDWIGALLAPASNRRSLSSIQKCTLVLFRVHLLLSSCSYSQVVSDTRSSGISKFHCFAVITRLARDPLLLVGPNGHTVRLRGRVVVVLRGVLFRFDCGEN